MDEKETDRPDSSPLHRGSGFPSRIRQKTRYLFSRKDKSRGDTRPGEGRGSCRKQRTRQQSLPECSLPPRPPGVRPPGPRPAGRKRGESSPEHMTSTGAKIERHCRPVVSPRIGPRTARGEALLAGPPASHRRPGTPGRRREAWTRTQRDSGQKSTKR